MPPVPRGREGDTPTVKSIARALVPEAHWNFLSWHRDRFGVAASLRSYLRYLGGGRGLARVAAGPAGPVYLRPGTSDQSVFDEVFVGNEYAVEAGDPRYILDAGAHIGLASVYFASRYPKATVVALEPEPSNFALLVQNCGRFPSVRPVQAALWCRPATLRVENPEGATWSFRVTESPDGSGIEAKGIEDLMTAHGFPRIDVLKMDIEGAEREVLRGSDAWLDKVGLLIIELHDRFAPGCSEALDRAIRGRDFERSVSGESVVLRRRSRAHDGGAKP